MNCKNCNHKLESKAHFCDNCGARIIKSRISFKFLIIEFFTAMDIESAFFRTLKKMFTKPHEVLNEYLSGVRKKYINPFTYLAIGAAIALVSFNYFSEDYIKIQRQVNSNQIKQWEELAKRDLSKVKNVSKKELLKLQQQQQVAKTQLKFLSFWFELFLKYFNIMSFVFLPFYAFLSKWTYRKPHNYGEHLIMNAYLQGSTMYISVLAFFLGILISPSIFIYSMFITIAYYLYSFSKLYNHSFGKATLKLLRFVLVLLITFIIIILLTFIISFILHKIGITKLG